MDIIEATFGPGSGEGHMVEIGDHRNRHPFINQIAGSIRRYRWKNTPFERDLLFTLVITDKCTLRCEHCFEEAGPENNTFLDPVRIENLAEESIDVFRKYQNREIRITGGDPFLHPELYQIIESFSKRRDLLRYDALDVETNGWWATDNETAEQYIKMLKGAGATDFSMTGDYFHHEQGKFDTNEHFDRINKIARRQRLRFRNITSGTCLSDDDEIREKMEEYGHMLPEVTPIGRARLLPEKYWEGVHPCNEEGCRLTPPTLARVIGKYKHTDEITIQRDGNVYPCYSGKGFEHATLSIGNIYEDSLPEIIENQNNPIVQLLREKELRGLSRAAGIPLREHWEMYYKFTPCGLCHELLREYGEKIAEKL